MATANKLHRIRRGILRWYPEHSRPFPWRETRNPYRILVSEIMLQQTQADRVNVLYPKFLSKYPTLDELCDAPRADVVRAWKGLGYNNRAVRLHAAVREIRSTYNGKVPSDIVELDSLPGIGKYTSHAVACFAFGRKNPLVDVNVRRVLSRIFQRMNTPQHLLDEETVWKIAERILPRDAYTWNQALMELGARVCTARSPRCDECPVSSDCASTLRLKSARLYTTRSASLPGTVQPPPAEPSHFGIPRRIWRGKIVEHLREKGSSVNVTKLARALRPGGREKSTLWLETILGRLEKDGIVKVSRYGSIARVGLA